MEAANPFRITFKNLTYTIRGRRDTLQHTLLDNVSGSCRSPRLTAILGPSGAGKTTLVRHLCPPVPKVDRYASFHLEDSQTKKLLAQSKRFDGSVQVTAAEDPGMLPLGWQAAWHCFGEWAAGTAQTIQASGGCCLAE